jgi:hypothetical protein
VHSTSLGEVILVLNLPPPVRPLNFPAVKMPSTMHEVQWGKIEAWLQSAGKPNEQALKSRMRELLRI